MPTQWRREPYHVSSFRIPYAGYSISLSKDIDPGTPGIVTGVMEFSAMRTKDRKKRWELRVYHIDAHGERTSDFIDTLDTIDSCVDRIYEYIGYIA